MGLTSSTTTVTLRTARVLATSSPTPEEPCLPFEKYSADIRAAVRTSCHHDDLLAPVERSRAEEQAALVTVEARIPLEKPLCDR